MTVVPRHPATAALDFLYGIFRMTLAGTAEAEAAVAATVATAWGASGRRAWPPCDAALIDAGVAELANRPLSGPVPISTPKSRPSAMNPRLADLVAGMSDETLAALVRALDPHHRRAVVLTVMLGVDISRTATALGCSPQQAQALAASGVDELTSRLAAYAAETERMGAVAALTAYHLRPVKPGPSAGMIVVRGDRAMVEEAPTSGFFYLALKALAHILSRMFHPWGHSALDNDVGEPTKAPKTRPTATSKRFRKPDPTPSMTDYRTPEPTRGIATYRMPKTTPSTARLASRSRPLSSGTPGSHRPRRSFL